MTLAPTLTTERLILRKPDNADLDSAIAFWQSERAAAVGGPFNNGRAWRAFAGIMGHWSMLGYGPFTVIHKETDQAIGLIGPCYSGDYNEPELGWDIWDQSYEGKGIAFEAASAARDYIFDVLGWKALASYVDDDNSRSMALAKRLGGIADTKPDTTFGDICWVYRYAAPTRNSVTSKVEAVV